MPSSLQVSDARPVAEVPRFSGQDGRGLAGLPPTPFIRFHLPTAGVARARKYLSRRGGGSISD